MVQVRGCTSCGLLPAATRAAVQLLVAPEVAASITAVAAALRDAASERDGQQLLLVRRFAARVSNITCAQLLSVLQLLQGTLRCTVTVAL